MGIESSDFFSQNFDWEVAIGTMDPANQLILSLLFVFIFLPAHLPGHPPCQVNIVSSIIFVQL